jgi:hypothetical protein
VLNSIYGDESAQDGAPAMGFAEVAGRASPTSTCDAGGVPGLPAPALAGQIIEALPAEAATWCCSTWPAWEIDRDLLVSSSWWTAA